MNDPLHQYLYTFIRYQEDEVLSGFVKKISEDYLDAVDAIIFYGSCMRTQEYKDAVLDFYVVVDDYRHAYSSRWYWIANMLLPPNVFYLQIVINGQIYRSKYAVISKKALLSRVSDRAFHSYFWARFTQPFNYLFLRDENSRKWLAELQATSIRTFHKKVSNTLPGDVSSHEFWEKGFNLTYLSELRAESKGRATSIYQANASFYDDVFRLVHERKNQTSKNLFSWKVRMLAGKLLSVLRLLKATTTFAGGVDYIAWKIERHTGEKIEVNDRLRKYPWVYGWPVLVRLFLNKSIR